MSTHPDNRYELTTMTWKPAKSRLFRPYTTCIVQLLEEDIEAGRLVPGTKLPPQRLLADWLGVDVDTISKAYGLCREKGILQTFRTKGSFITLPKKDAAGEDRTGEGRDRRNAPADLGEVVPLYSQNEWIRQYTERLLSGADAAELFGTRSEEDTAAQEKAGSAFLQDCGLTKEAAESPLITEGSQSALAACLTALFDPGDVIACDRYTDEGFLRLAFLLHLVVLPVESDEEGMKPSSLAFLCREKKVRGIYLNPDSNNPTGLRISKSRRSILIKVIRRHGLLLLEDGSFSPLCAEPIPPMSLALPDQAIYLSGFASAVGPGLLTSYAAVPKAYLEKVETASRSLGRHCLPLLPKIAEQLISSGTSRMITEDKKKELALRNETYGEIFPEQSTRKDTLYQWLRLPESMDGGDLEKYLLTRNIIVFGAEHFLADTGAARNFLRVSTGTPKTREQLQENLALLKTGIDAYRSGAMTKRYPAGSLDSDETTA
ncbi:MAG: PLP-dependent aminotransferase family protein [Lachnospiraceae bacterium]|nr:PLP-dependent aminotransferase family protein [Lachnospiraceae bacterium]